MAKTVSRTKIKVIAFKGNGPLCTKIVINNTKTEHIRNLTNVGSILKITLISEERDIQVKFYNVLEVTMVL